MRVILCTRFFNCYHAFQDSTALIHEPNVYSLTHVLIYMDISQYVLLIPMCILPVCTWVQSHELMYAVYAYTSIRTSVYDRCVYVPLYTYMHRTYFPWQSMLTPNRWFTVHHRVLHFKNITVLGRLDATTNKPSAIMNTGIH